MSERKRLLCLIDVKDVYAKLEANCLQQKKEMQANAQQRRIDKKCAKAKARGETEDNIAKIRADEETKLKIRQANREGNEEQVKKLVASLNFPPKKPEVDYDHLDRLARPNDKWKLGKMLLELKKEFPHDRVLERMIAAEFASN